MHACIVVAAPWLSITLPSRVRLVTAPGPYFAYIYRSWLTAYHSSVQPETRTCQSRLAIFSHLLLRVCCLLPYLPRYRKGIRFGQLIAVFYVDSLAGLDEQLTEASISPITTLSHGLRCVMYAHSCLSTCRYNPSLRSSQASPVVQALPYALLPFRFLQIIDRKSVV